MNLRHFYFLGLTLVTLVNIQARSLPKNWEKMEIEAKWTITPAQYQKLIDDLVDGSKFEGHDLKVRWEGRSNKFVDEYFDDNEGSLGQAGHALRLRTRYTTSNRDADISDYQDWEFLESAAWEKEWERIQYKSTPYREKAIWYRMEKGDCLVWSFKESDKDLCHRKKEVSWEEYLLGEKKHPALKALEKDHEGFDLNQLSKTLKVVDYRYRIEFYKKDKLKFEMSLDQLGQWNYRTQEQTYSFEAELEILEKKVDEKTLDKLREMVEKLQRKYRLTPSTHSKSGIFIEEGMD